MTDSFQEGLEQIIGTLGLRELGYEIEMVNSDGLQAGLELRHPLRGGEITFGFSAKCTKESWTDDLKKSILKWPDLDVVRAGSTLRPESIALLGALRHAELIERMRFRRNPSEQQAAVEGVFETALCLKGKLGLLNDIEIIWLMNAFESDDQEFSRDRDDK